LLPVARCLLAFAAILFFLPLTTPSTAVAQSSGPLRWGYFVPDDPTSLASLSQRSGNLDYVGLHWATMCSDGTVESKTNPTVLSLVRSLRAKSLLSVTAGSAEIAHSILASESSRATAIENLLRSTAEYDGISIDFEGLDPGDRDGLTGFMSQLAGRFRPTGKLVTMALSAKTSDARTGWAGAMDYAALAPHADLFVLMAYGFRTARSTTPGSAAPISWVEDTLEYAVSQIPASKILLGVPFYGYDWNTTAGPPAKVLRGPDAASLASRYGATITVDPTQQSACLSYTDSDGHSHQAWFENRASLAPKLDLVRRHNLAGVAAWRLGHEDPEVWPAIDALRSGQQATPKPVEATPKPIATLVDTPANPQRSWYFAEGSTAPPFDSWLLLQNPNNATANATVTFMQDNGTSTTHHYSLAPTSRFSIFINQLVPKAAVSTLVQSDHPIFAERAMYFRTDGHGSPGVNQPATTWYLAEGSTAPPFDSWILVMNPNPTPTRVTFTLMLEGGVNKTVVRDLPPTSRASLFANQELPPTAFSARVEGTAPIIVERAMYLSSGGGHGTMAITTPSRQWYLAEGDTRAGYDSWLLLMNPNDTPASATVTLAKEDGTLLVSHHLVGPRSRYSLFINQLMPDARLSVQVQADQPIVAERAMYFGRGGAHNTVASPRLARTWYLPEGSTASPFQEYVLIANPNGFSTNATVTWMQEGGKTSTQSVTLPANGRATLDANRAVPNAAVSARVDATAPVVVERSMYFSNGNGGTNTIGIPDAQ